MSDTPTSLPLEIESATPVHQHYETIVSLEELAKRRALIPSVRQRAFEVIVLFRAKIRALDQRLLKKEVRVLKFLESRPLLMRRGNVSRSDFEQMLKESQEKRFELVSKETILSTHAPSLSNDLIKHPEDSWPMRIANLLSQQLRSISHCQTQDS